MPAPRPNRDSYDAVVVGARCAGSATAMLLARSGLRVLAVERSQYGSDTLSTLALMRAGVFQLHRWGLLPALEAAGTPAVRRTTFHYAEETIDVAIKPRDGYDALYAPRRTVLDAALADAAADAGAEVVHGVHVRELLRSPGGRVEGVVIQQPGEEARRIQAGIVIGADGRNSTVAKTVGAHNLQLGQHTTGVVYGYFSGLAPRYASETTGYDWYYRPGTSAGTIPTNDDLTLVFASVPARRFHAEMRGDIAAGFFQVLKETSPELAERIAGATQVGRFWGFPGVPGHLRQSWGPGWALVGDAGYFKDPLTAHGISDALRDAELLARAVADGTDADLFAYQEQRDELSLRFFDVTDRIASFDWDLDTVKRYHLEASEEMKREVDAMRVLYDRPEARRTAGRAA